MKEIWKDIEGYEGLYQVSNLGRVKSLNYNHTRKPKVLSLMNGSRGYMGIKLGKEGTITFKSVHRLVAQAFIPNPNNYPYINHKDENKKNNVWTNLEWCTAKYNTNYNNLPKRRGIKARKRVNQYDKQGNFIKTWDSMTSIYETLKYNSSGISSCCSGKYKTSHGYIWRYAD